ncbi:MULTISPECIES: CopG family transcriptional regulator [Thermococcus]|uniref:CopG family transcriptional regulator n=1 Tax=Thermococcus radiotolerans TaxID=187880 RepID=A0A2Z2MZ45_9EURY|nr:MULTISPECIES: CopG family transcriptional regulator [Thermococcus]ASA78031.1 CopG family transcriptional regulator [Thermococcus sp. 5-4]ASJ14771.1 CopG family transcriptional regulator [Thermococcus radiotolerans]
MSKDKIPKLFDGSVNELTRPSRPKKDRKAKSKDMKKEKKQKTLYVSLDMNRKLIELYGEEGRRQSIIVEDALNLYYYLKLALGEKKFDELMSAVKREDPEFLREYMGRFKL